MRWILPTQPHPQRTRVVLTFVVAKSVGGGGGGQTDHFDQTQTQQNKRKVRWLKQEREKGRGQGLVVAADGTWYPDGRGGGGGHCLVVQINQLRYTETCSGLVTHLYVIIIIIIIKRTSRAPNLVWARSASQ